jgi:4'-phosphopantetheinyl transferase
MFSDHELDDEPLPHKTIDIEEAIATEPIVEPIEELIAEQILEPISEPIPESIATNSDIWAVPPKQLTLPPTAVHIWRASLSLPEAQLDRMAQTLSPDEHQRAERFRFAQHKQRFIASRGVLRLILSRYLAIAPEQVQFCYAAQGKPALASNDQQWLQFNLSHSGEMAVYAISQQQVGIDLEQLRDIEATPIAQRFFSTNEYAAMQALSPEQQAIAFFQLWTCKEAYLKATGDGLAALQQIEIVATPSDLNTLLNYQVTLQLSSDWFLMPFKPDANYVAALAVAGRVEQFNYVVVPDELSLLS